MSGSRPHHESEPWSSSGTAVGSAATITPSRSSAPVVNHGRASSIRSRLPWRTRTVVVQPAGGTRPSHTNAGTVATTTGGTGRALLRISVVASGPRSRNASSASVASNCSRNRLIAVAP